jgi:diguanylate cyclase (GGDEF)-like protein/PAS domain S-box-containing protein
MKSKNKRPARKLAAPIQQKAARFSPENSPEPLSPPMPEIAFRSFIENLPVMFYAAEPVAPYKPMYISPAFAQLGYPLADWENSLDMWICVIHPQDRDWVLEKTETAIRNGEDIDYEYRLIARGGDVRWVRDRGCLIQNESGETVCWQGIILDITERKRAEELLIESEEQYRNVFENANDLIYVHDLEGNYTSINQAAERLFGYTREEALRMNISQIAAPEHLELTNLRLAEKIGGAKQTTYEIDCITKDGCRVTLEVNSTGIFKNGELVAVQGIARDITKRKQVEKTLKDSEEQYRDLFENANDLIYTHDLQGNFTSLNRAGEIITGYSREEALNMNISRVVAPDFLETARRMTARKVGGEVPTVYELEIIAKNGNRVSLEISTRLIFQNNIPVGVQGIGRDITERKQAEDALKLSERRYRFLSEGIMHQVWTATPDGRVDYTNRRTLEYFGYTLEHVLNEGWKDAVHPDDLHDCLARWKHSIQTGEYYEVEFRLRRADGVYRWHLARANAALDTNGKIINWFGTNTDIDDKKAAEEKLNHYALHDALTELPNRTEFLNHLKTAIKRAAGDESFRFAVLFLDLDRFKVVNDSLGHVIGDKLLVGIARRLKSCVRPGDVVARLGGDEFTILLNQSGGAAEVAKVAVRLQEKLSKPFIFDNHEVFSSASIGIIISDADHLQPEDFLRDADAAMYRAKESGKARFEIFDSEMHVRNINLLQLETDLRRAVERNEFEVFYQPIVCMETGSILEFEALVRWQHPTHGLIAPGEFISIAEETGLIIQIGELVLSEACRQTVRWQKRYPEFSQLSVSVNLSAKQLMHPSLTAQVKEVLRRTRLEPQYLKLEVTESTVMENSETALRVLSELNALGISLSTDDFGTGYSSLSYLHRFPFQRMKIDRSFINRMDADIKSEAIVRSILMLGKNLEIETVAEGIENEEQLWQLRSLGCPFGQGYLFSPPVAAVAAEKLLREGLFFSFASMEVPFSFADTKRRFIELDKVQ